MHHPHFLMRHPHFPMHCPSTHAPCTLPLVHTPACPPTRPFMPQARKHAERAGRPARALTAVERAADFGSDLYAPPARAGRFVGARAGASGPLETEGYMPASLAGLQELQATMPARLTSPRRALALGGGGGAKARATAPGGGTGWRPAAMRLPKDEARVRAALAHIAGKLEASKATVGRGHGDCWPQPLPEPAARTGARAARAQQRGVMPPEQPSTQSLPPARSGDGGNAAAAALLLQRLLRGRAAQNAMFHGRVSPVLHARREHSTLSRCRSFARAALSAACADSAACGQRCVRAALRVCSAPHLPAAAVTGSCMASIATLCPGVALQRLACKSWQIPPPSPPCFYPTHLVTHSESTLSQPHTLGDTF
eukprot:357397-Chlamydomonas_euryale.AAC.9